MAITSADGKTTFASAKVSHLTDQWKKYDVNLKTKNVPASKNNLFVISAGAPGVIWFGLVSLFPPTFNNRPNGNRTDIMQLLAEMHPRSCAFPAAITWRATPSPTASTGRRPSATLPTPRPHERRLGILVLRRHGPAGVSGMVRRPAHAAGPGRLCRIFHAPAARDQPGADLQPYVQDALDEIEYVTGDASTTWGARRAQDGHPAPFPLNYVEMGNEDWFDRKRGATTAASRSSTTPSRPGIRSSAARSPPPAVQPARAAGHDGRSLLSPRRDEMRLHAHDYDNRDRTGPKVFVGEWATRVGAPTPNMAPPWATPRG